MRSMYYKSEAVAEHLTNSLMEILERDAIFVCIGTDRCTGDSLGPLVGTMLSKYDLGDHIVYGTIKHPVHALTIEKTVAEIQEKYKDRQVIAIDAASGLFSGYMRVKDEPILPGLGVGKTLPAIGDYSIVATTCTKNENILYTRLDLIFDMAEIIVGAITKVIAMESEESSEMSL